MDTPSPPLIERFDRDLRRVWPEGGRLGLAVSGGPDSVALLLLASVARAGQISVATVDHGLRPESRDEAEFVAALCRELGLSHQILTVEVEAGNVQDKARSARYAALAEWMTRERISALATAHHADDQAETLLMRLNRASGVSGLAGVRARTTLPDSDLLLLRPLLEWRRSELETVVSKCGVSPVHDPSNENLRFDRVKMRQELANVNWLDRTALAMSVKNLAEADEALDWAAQREWNAAVTLADGLALYLPEAPQAIRLRVVARILRHFGQEGRGADVARLVTSLAEGKTGNVAGVLARPTKRGWEFTREPPRRS